MRRWIPIIAACLVATGCAAARPKFPATHDMSFFLGRYDKVWEVTVKVLESRSLEIKDINRENGVITTRFTNYSAGPKAHHDIEKIAERPPVRLALYTQVGYSLQIILTPVNDMSTQVRVKATIEAYDSNATKQWHTCTSKGLLEQDILRAIKQSL